MQKKENAPYNPLKKNRKMEDKKRREAFIQENCLHKSASKGTRSNRIPSPHPNPSHDK
jgi:hypothetical protein